MFGLNDVIHDLEGEVVGLNKSLKDFEAHFVGIIRMLVDNPTPAQINVVKKWLEEEYPEKD